MTATERDFPAAQCTKTFPPNEKTVSKSYHKITNKLCRLQARLNHILIKDITKLQVKILNPLLNKRIRQLSGSIYNMRDMKPLNELLPTL